MNPHSAEEDSAAGKKSRLFKLTKSNDILSSNTVGYFMLNLAKTGTLQAPLPYWMNKHQHRKHSGSWASLS